MRERVLSASSDSRKRVPLYHQHKDILVYEIYLSAINESFSGDTKKKEFGIPNSLQIKINTISISL